MSRETILFEINNERVYQQKRWGDNADDTQNAPNDFVSYIAHHSTRWFNGGFAPYSSATVAEFRRQMIKVAALAVAAIESIDRQQEKVGKTFYETVG
jgi:hypothetical protein